MKINSYKPLGALLSGSVSLYIGYKHTTQKKIFHASKQSIRVAKLAQKALKNSEKETKKNLSAVNLNIWCEKKDTDLKKIKQQASRLK